jgi:hypothetical protein
MTYQKPRHVLAKLRGRLRKPHSGTDDLPDVDLTWFTPLAASVFAQQRHAASSMLSEIDPFLDAFHRGVSVTLDSERGSLLLGFSCGSFWRFAVDDVESAAQIAAAARLGGLLLRLTDVGEGLIRIHGVWGRFSYVLCGLPVRNAFTA